MKTQTRRSFLFLSTLLFFPGSVCLACLACGTPEAKIVEGIAVRVAEDVCKELQDAGADPYVTLLCTLADGRSAKVQIPGTEWHAIKARKVGSVDAGPGK